MRRTWRAVPTAALIALFTAVPAAGEGSLDDLVVLPPTIPESLRGPTGIAEFYQEEAGVGPGEIVEEVSVVPHIGDPRRGTLLAMRGTRFVDAATAERVAQRLALREVATVKPLGGTLGDGFVVVSNSPQLAGGRITVHDAFRVRGRDIFLYLASTQDTTAVPQDLIDLVAWHAERYPGSSTTLDLESGVDHAPLLAAGIGVSAVAVGTAVLLVRRSRRRRLRASVAPRTAVTWVPDSSGWSSRPAP